MRDMAQYGPNVDVPFDEVAKLFGWEPRTLRDLIRQGKFPRPMGFGANEYYSGTDIAAIRLLLGRWQPDVSAENSPKRGQKGNKDEGERAAEDG